MFFALALHQILKRMPFLVAGLLLQNRYYMFGTIIQNMLMKLADLY